MSALARPITQSVALRDIRRDWRRWSQAERCGAVTIIMLASIALPAAMLILAHSV
jgi:hypothetical protein